MQQREQRAVRRVSFRDLDSHRAARLVSRDTVNENYDVASGKQCPICSVWKPIVDFYFDKAGADGHRPACKTCDNRRRSLWRAEHRQRDTETQQRSYWKHREKWLMYQRNWRATHPVARRAGHEVEMAVKTGTMIRPNRCSKCGQSTRLHGHHPNYTDPLNIVWVCSSCHRLIHLDEKRKVNVT